MKKFPRFRLSFPTTDSRVPYSGGTLPVAEEKSHQTVPTKSGFSINALDHHHQASTCHPTALHDHGHIRPQNPTLPRCLPPGFFDDVDTTLSLRPPGTNTKNSTSAAADIPPPPPPLYKWQLPGFFEDDEVDTTLSLRPPDSNNTKKSTRQEPQTSDSPTHPWWLPPRVEEDDATDDKSRKWLREEDIPPPVTTNNKSRKRSRPSVEEDRPLIPFQGLMRIIQLHGGAGAEFLYQKRLEESDVSRLMVTRSEGMMGFLRGHEAAAVGGKGLETVGIDCTRNVYDKLVMNKRDTSLIISSGWKEVIARNKAQIGDVIEIWGYRHNAKSCFAFNFKTDHNPNAAAA